MHAHGRRQSRPRGRGLAHRPTREARAGPQPVSNTSDRCSNPWRERRAAGTQQSNRAGASALGEGVALMPCRGATQSRAERPSQSSARRAGEQRTELQHSAERRGAVRDTRARAAAEGAGGAARARGLIDVRGGQREQKADHKDSA